jgi:hypothetical protein
MREATYLPTRFLEPSFHNLDKTHIFNQKDIDLKRSGIENKILGNRNQSTTSS